MSYQYAIYALLVCTVFVVGCKGEAAGPGPTVAPHQSASIEIERED